MQRDDNGVSIVNVAIHLKERLKQGIPFKIDLGMSYDHIDQKFLMYKLHHKGLRSK